MLTARQTIATKLVVDSGAAQQAEDAAANANTAAAVAQGVSANARIEANRAEAYREEAYRFAQQPSGNVRFSDGTNSGRKSAFAYAKEAASHVADAQVAVAQAQAAAGINDVLDTEADLIGQPPGRYRVLSYTDAPDYDSDDVIVTWSGSVATSVGPSLVSRSEIIGEENMVRAAKLPSSLSRHGEYASRLIQLRATGESKSLSADFNYTKLNTQESLISGNTSKLHAWVFDLPAPAWVDLDLPFGVVIGDSIAEGHPERHGRLHPDGSNAFDDDYPNQTGQTSYELGVLTGMYWYNHGVGSQTSTQVLARWNRDVLAMTDDPGDGRGDKTLPRQPYVVYVHVGVNDVALDVPASTIKANLLAMAKSAHEAGILAIFDNIGPYNSANSAQQAVIDEVNAWMDEALGAYGAVVVDYNAWANNGGGDNRTDLIGDGIHPTRGGYKALARYIADNVKLPIYLNGLQVEGPWDPTDGPSGYTRPAEFLIECGTQKLFERVAYEEQQYVPLNLEGQATSLRLTVQRVHLPASSTRSGFSKVRAVMGAERIRTSRVRRLAGTVRDQGGTGDSTNYAFIEDDDHAPVGFTGASAEAAGRVRVTYPECKRVVSFIAGCDEQMAALDYEVGASAGLSYADISIRRHLAGIGCYLFSNGTTYQVGSVGNGITNVSYNSATGVITITHDNLGEDAIPVATPASGSPAVQIGSLTPTTIQLRFVDSSGNAITGAPPATHQAYVFRQRPAATVTDVQNLAITQGNIWIMAELEY